MDQEKSVPDLLIEPLAEGLVKLESMIEIRYQRLEQKIKNQLSLFDQIDQTGSSAAMYARIQEIRKGFDHVQIEVEGARNVLLEEASELNEDLQSALDILQGLQIENKDQSEELSEIAVQLRDIADQLNLDS